jgi:AcrR family transcriptional regulator
VQRHTVYAHFPDEADLFAACTGLWEHRNPFPDAGAWAAIEDPRERLSVALHALYAFYSRSGGDLVVVFTGAEQTPSMRRSLADRAQHYAAIAEVLARGRGARGRRRARLLAALEHAVHLDTWRSLCAQGGLTEAEAVALLIGLVETADSLGHGTPQ